MPMFTMNLIHEIHKEVTTESICAVYSETDLAKATLKLLNESSNDGFEVERVEVWGDSVADDHGIYMVEYRDTDHLTYQQVYFTHMYNACKWVTDVAAQYGHKVSGITEIFVFNR